MPAPSDIVAIEPTAPERESEVPSLAPAMPPTAALEPQPSALADARAAPWVERAEELIRKARAADPWEQPGFADELNQCFEALEEHKGARATTDFLVKQLESGALTGLSDSAGRTARAGAVRALLALGYPFALEVSPEDLQHYRGEESRRRRRALPLGLYAVVPLLASFGVSFFSSGGALRTAELELSLGGAVGAALAALSPRSLRRRALGFGLLASVGLAAGVLAFLGSPILGVTAAGCALAFGAALWRPKSERR